MNGARWGGRRPPRCRQAAGGTGVLLVHRLRYDDRFGRPKACASGRMEVVAGEFQPNDEVEVLAWVSPG